MCGIAGLTGPGIRDETAQAMVHSLAHRGPDARGTHRDRMAFLGQTRLSVIDLLTGDQPMSDRGGTAWLVHNGEIYNYRELRRELEARGRSFRTGSDTEVILQGYLEWGLGLLPKLDGIFAFALWETGRQRLLLARDPLGVKPLHYHFDGRIMRFASEVKAILQDPAVPREADPESLHLFLNLRYVPGQRTLFKGVSRLKPGHYLILEKGALTEGRFFELRPRPETGRGADHFREGIGHYLRAAVRKQLVSDVPVGVFLSGGLDSSAVTALMCRESNRPVRTFTLGLGEPTDELAQARLVADYFGTVHHERTIAPELFRSFPRVIWHTEEPKENVLQGFLLSRFARREVKVVLSGLGGDELFGGYQIHRLIAPLRNLHRLVPRAAVRDLLRPLSGLAYRAQAGRGSLSLDHYRRGLQFLLALGDPARGYLILRNAWDHDPEARRLLYGPALLEAGPGSVSTAFQGFFNGRSPDALEEALWAELNTKLVDDLLLNEDRTSMAHGLEVRVPFLDRDLVDFALTIPAGLKVRHGRTKHLFRQSVAPLLPRATVERGKWGFSFDPVVQFSRGLKSTAERVLTRERVEARGWFNYAYLRRIMDHRPHPRLRWHYFFLWLALGLEIWARLFLEGDLGRPRLELEDYYP